MASSDDVVKRVEEASKEFMDSLEVLIKEHKAGLKMSLKMERVIHELVKKLDKKEK